MAKSGTKRMKSGGKGGGKSGGRGGLIAFDSGELLPRGRRIFLRVSGQKPYANMKVSLQPLVYIQKPDYWGWQVVGSLNGVGLPTMTPYTVEADVTRGLGNYGVDVIGKNKRKKLDIPRPRTTPAHTPAHPEVARLLDRASAGDETGATTKKRKKDIEDRASQHPQYARCQWLGRCYYCYFAGKWWRIGCM